MTRSRAESGVLAKIGIGVLEPSRAFLIAGLTVSLGCVICTLCVSQADRPSTEVLAATDPGAAGANFLQRSPSEASTPSSAPLFATEAVSSTSSTSSSSGAVSPSAASPSPSKNGHWNAFIKAEEKVLNHLASGNKGKALSVGDVAFSGPFLDRKCSAAIEQMGAELKLNPCTEQEQLESAFLFGETAEKGAGSTAFTKFCNSACINRVVSIGRRTVLRACKILDQSSHFERLLLICPPDTTPNPTVLPSRVPSTTPTVPPSALPSNTPTFAPTHMPSPSPTWGVPTFEPTVQPTITFRPSAMPTGQPSAMPTGQPSAIPTMLPSAIPSDAPSFSPSIAATSTPTQPPQPVPTAVPTFYPTMPPAEMCEMVIGGDPRFWNATNFHQDIGILLALPSHLVAIKQVQKAAQQIDVVFTILGGTSLRSCCKELSELLQAKDKRIIAMHTKSVQRYDGAIPAMAPH